MISAGGGTGLETKTVWIDHYVCMNGRKNVHFHLHLRGSATGVRHCGALIFRWWQRNQNTTFWWSFFTASSRQLFRECLELWSCLGWEGDHCLFLALSEGPLPVSCAQSLIIACFLRSVSDHCLFLALSEGPLPVSCTQWVTTACFLRSVTDHCLFLTLSKWPLLVSYAQ